MPTSSTGVTPSPTSPDPSPAAVPGTAAGFSLPPPAPHRQVSASRRPLLGADVTVLRAVYRSQHFSRHAHQDYALGVIFSGALAFRYRGEGLVAAPGQVSLAQPGIPHDGAPAVPDGWGYRMLYLPAEVLAQVMRNRGTLPFFRAGVIDDPRLAAAVTAAHSLLLDPHSPVLAKESALLDLLSFWVARHAARTSPPPVPGPEPGAVRLVLEYLDAHFAEEVDLADLSRIAGLSPWHLVRVLTRHTGLPPHAHLLDRRCLSARRLLSGSDRLADIAAATGFADQSHLTRAFAARFGLTPGAYRKILQNTPSHPD